MDYQHFSIRAPINNKRPKFKNKERLANSL